MPDTAVSPWNTVVSRRNIAILNVGCILIVKKTELPRTLRVKAIMKQCLRNLDLEGIIGF